MASGIYHPMRYVPLEHDINIAVNDPFRVEVANPEHPFTAMLISHSRGTCLIHRVEHKETYRLCHVSRVDEENVPAVPI